MSPARLQLIKRLTRIFYRLFRDLAHLRCPRCGTPNKPPGEFMTKIAPALAIAFVMALASVAQASDAPTTKADCEKAHMTWDDAHHKCTK